MPVGGIDKRHLNLFYFWTFGNNNNTNNNNNNNNNNHLYFMRVTQSNTRFDFHCGPQI